MRRLLASAFAGCGLFASVPPPSCPPDRIVVLDDQARVEEFAVCTRASGVAIRTGSTVEVGALTKLERIEGDLAIGPTVGVEEIDLTELREVTGTVRVVANPSLRKLFLPRLERAGRFEVDHNESMKVIAVPRLSTVVGALTITDNRRLELVQASSLVSVGKSLVIANDPALTHVLATALHDAETVMIEDTQLAPDAVDALRAKSVVELR